MNEADTCRKFVVPALVKAGWDSAPRSINEQACITDGRIIPVGDGFVRKKPKKVDYLLKFTRDFPLAVVEAKADYLSAQDGVQQAREYAEMLGLKFAYATNGVEIIEIDYFSGQEIRIDEFPTPETLWLRFQQKSKLNDGVAKKLLEPMKSLVGIGQRYYQYTAINRTVEAILTGEKRILLTMATGTGKTNVSFQIVWKLWNSKWNLKDENRKPRILYLADMNILIDQPKDGIFAAFGDARHKIESGDLVESREIYFAIYQAIASDERREGIFKQYPSDFFDLVIVDECHRGSARDESSWRDILEYFSPAVQLGLTATPAKNEAADTYKYFGDPVYEYSLKQGIEDGYLAPYRVHRVITEWDAAGWRPTLGEIDRFGRSIPDEVYDTSDFERVIALKARTEAIAKHLTQYLKSVGRFEKTLVFCVDQEHASEMRQALINMNSDLVAEYPDYVSRVTSDEGDIGRGLLSKFQDLDSRTPVILTTSKMLTTGVDAPTVKNVVLARVVRSMTEFKQIIGRGTRVRDDYGKLWFNIFDYTGSATTLFADPSFDGDPVFISETNIDSEGTETLRTVIADESERFDNSELGKILEPQERDLRKYYVDSGYVNVIADIVYEMDQNGNQLRVIKYSTYVGETVRAIYGSPPELRAVWVDPNQRIEIIDRLKSKGVDLDKLAFDSGFPEADPLDLLCHVAFSLPLRTRRERASKLQENHKEFFALYSPIARQILQELVEKYALFGEQQFVLPDILKVDPISGYGQPAEIAMEFGGASELKSAVLELQSLLYAF